MGLVDVAVIGGGIVGLATAWQLRQRRPDLRLVVLEKEGQLLRMEPSQDGIRAIVRSVSTCLGCFHACNIVHGDVKVARNNHAARFPSAL